MIRLIKDHMTKGQRVETMISYAHYTYTCVVLLWVVGSSNWVYLCIRSYVYLYIAANSICDA